MPIININLLPQHPDVDIPYVLQMLANKVANEMNIPEYAVRCTCKNYNLDVMFKVEYFLLKDSPLKATAP